MQRYKKTEGERSTKGRELPEERQRALSLCHALCERNNAEHRNKLQVASNVKKVKINIWIVLTRRGRHSSSVKQFYEGHEHSLPQKHISWTIQ